MAQASGLSWGSKRVGTSGLNSRVKLSRIKHPGLALSFATAGALGFWLPDLIIHILAGRNLDSRHVLVITILSPAIFLLTYVLARRFVLKQEFKWLGAAMVLGVWVTGGLFIALAATASGAGFAGPHGIRDSLLMVVSSVIPGVTFIFAAYDGSFLALLAVTVGALLVWGVRTSRVLLVVGSSSSNKNTTKEK